MNNDLPSKNKWETHAAMKRAQTDVARAQQQNISVEQLAAQDEAHRQSLYVSKNDIQPEHEQPAGGWLFGEHDKTQNQNISQDIGRGL